MGVEPTLALQRIPILKSGRDYKFHLMFCLLKIRLIKKAST